MEEADYLNGDHPITSMFNFLLLCLVRCVEEASGLDVETMHVNRIAPLDIVFSIAGTLDMNFPLPTLKSEDTVFKIVVDNTKEDE
jgi:hypothetical protein